MPDKKKDADLGAVTPDQDGELRFPGDEPKGEPEGSEESAAGRETPPGPAPDQDPDAVSVEKLQGHMVKHGIKDVGGIVDRADELERENTRLRQDNQRLSAATTFQPPAPSAVPAGAGGGAPDDEGEIEIPDNPVELFSDPKALRGFIKKVEDRAISRANRASDNNRNKAQFDQQRRQVAELQREDPEGFRELRGVMIEIAQERPDIQDLRQIHSMAKERHATSRKKLLDGLRRDLGFDSADGERLRGIISRVRTAPVSAGSGPQGGPGPGAPVDKERDDLLRAIENADHF